MEFKIGDEVEIVKNSRYSITKEGARGIITNMSDMYLKIKFYNLMEISGYYDLDTTFPISREYVKKIYIVVDMLREILGGMK